MKNKETYKFKIGEKVVCINDKKNVFEINELKQGKIYTIIGFNSVDGGLILAEIKGEGGKGAYLKERFISLNDVRIKKIKKILK